ncbi:transcription antitermination factor NusB [Candidatus Dependentiae bacterium]|nr:transcription antitermination factor NusB [Candidatus Dependentiae bacterium]
MTNKNDFDKSMIKKTFKKNAIQVISQRDIRALAFHFLYAAESYEYNLPIEEIIENFKIGFNLNIQDNSLAIKIAKAVIKNKKELDNLIIPLLHNWKIDRLSCCTRIILRMSLWELQQEGSFPSVVINEAIELAKCFAEKDSYKFINGILDEACKKWKLVKKEEKIK